MVGAEDNATKRRGNCECALWELRLARVVRIGHQFRLSFFQLSQRAATYDPGRDGGGVFRTRTRDRVRRDANLIWTQFGFRHRDVADAEKPCT